MTRKTRKTLTLINTVIICLMIGGGAIAKLMKMDVIVEGFTRIGVGQYVQLLGGSELVFLGLFLYPKTTRIGYLLLSAYLGGAIATHLSHADSPFSPIVPLVLVLILMVLRDRTFFTPTSNHFINY